MGFLGDDSFWQLWIVKQLEVTNYETSFHRREHKRKK